MLKRFREYRGEVTAIDQVSKTITINTPCGDSVCHYEKLEPEYWDILVDSLRFYDESNSFRRKHLVYVREIQTDDGREFSSFHIDYVKALHPNDPFYWLQGAEQIANFQDETGKHLFDKKTLEWLEGFFEQFPDDLPTPGLGFHEFTNDSIDILADGYSPEHKYYLGMIIVDLNTHEADIMICPTDDESDEEDRNFTLNMDKQEDIDKLWNLVRQDINGVLSPDWEQNETGRIS